MPKPAAHRDHPEVSKALPALGPALRRADAETLERARALARRAPNDARIHDLLSTALAMTAQREPAVAHARRALTLKPDDAALAARCVSVLQRAGAYDEALAATERARYANPDDRMLAGLRVTILTDLGRGPDAARALQALRAEIGDAPTPQESARLALMDARLAPTHTDARAAADALAPIVEDQRTPPGFRRAGAFQLGRLHESMGEHEHAFAFYTLGNETQKPDWDPDAHSTRIDACIRSVTDAWSDPGLFPKTTVDGSRLVFVLGMMRSGSSLLEQMLAQLDAVTPAGEQSLILPQIARIEAHRDRSIMPLPLHPERYDAARMDEIARRAMERYERLAPEGLITDKQTENALVAPLLSRLFPGCTIVLTTRDAMDCCVSNYVQSFAQDHPQSRDQRWIGRYRLDHERLMDAWRALPGFDMLEIDYADLVADPERETRRVADEIAVQWSERVLRFHESDRAIATASREQVREPIHARSVGRARRFAPWLAPLRETLGLAEP